MAMRLLTKDEITKQQNADKSREIAEGLKLSRRVDSLRELQAKEEQALELYRAKTLSAISAEIDELTKKKESVVSELKVLEANSLLEKNLFKKEKRRLEELRKNLENREKQIKEKQGKLNLLEKDIILSLKERNNAVLRAKTKEEETRRLLKKASEESTEANERLSNARGIEENLVQLKKLYEEDFERREIKVKAEENRINLEKESLKNVKRELEAERIRLADQRRTLERALERLGKNNPFNG